MIKKGTNIYIRPLTAEDAEACLELQNANRPFFEQFSMERNEEFYTIEGQKKRLQRLYENMENDEDYYFGIFDPANDALIGTINLFQVFARFLAKRLHRLFFRSEAQWQRLHDGSRQADGRVRISRSQAPPH